VRSEGGGVSAQHSPGPLIVSAIRRTMDGQQWLRVVTSKDNREVAYVPFGDRTPHEYHQCRADARLYAAAPDLVPSLQCMLALVLLKYGNLDPDVNVAVAAAQAALGKALGEHAEASSQ
jgi:hypothetical protein